MGESGSSGADLPGADLPGAELTMLPAGGLGDMLTAKGFSEGDSINGA